jgi:V/A-type H+/Na+-transporting ATPase subunit I
MIERMKKITILVSEQERKQFVAQLRKLGVLHVRNVGEPSSHEITFVEDRIDKIERLIAQISPYDAGRPDRRKGGHERDVLSCADAASEDQRNRLELEAHIERLEKDALWFEAWGGFDPADMAAAKDAGVNLRLYEVPKNRLRDLEREKVKIVGKKGDNLLAALITLDPEDTLDYEEVSPPNMSPEALYGEIDKARAEIKNIEERMRERARGLVPIKECKRKLEKEAASLRVRFGMREEGKFAYLQGYCPVKLVDKIKSIQRRHGLGYLIEEPRDPEETPTLVTNPKWVEIISPVFQFMNTLPGYEEFDISLPFLVFFSLFFAMLIGDAGYGALFLVLTFLARRKFRTAAGQPFFLMYLLSTCTLIWGAITGTWFGSEAIQKLPLLRSLVVPQLNSFSDTNQDFIMHLCFLIGAVQLSLAHIMKIVRGFNSLKVLSDAGWVMIVWGMYHAAQKFVLNVPFPAPAGWLLMAGGVLALVFSDPERGILKGMAATIINLPLSVIGSFSDVISYIRLFAVGMATVVVAESFNNMAMAGGMNSILSGLIAALVLFFGHALNIALGFMAVIVHGVRLNVLEFSGHLGMQWSGRKYDPFKE